MNKEPIKVLDDGFVRLVDTMGDDKAIVQAARVSYGVGTKSVSEDEGLIRYLIRNKHTSPLEMCEIKLHVRVPMDTWRQWIRHRTANVNEYSTRYSLAIDSMAKTKPNEWRLQSSNNKQGSDGFLDIKNGEVQSLIESQIHKDIKSVYDSRIGDGIAREQARKDLPLSTYTEAYWKIDLHNLLHFLRLRLDPHAQYEIRQYAEAIAQIVKEWVPLTYKAFLDYEVNSITFSSREIIWLEHIIERLTNEMAPWNLDIYSKTDDTGWFKVDSEGKLKKNGERKEFEDKLKNLGLKAPWQT